MPHYLILLTSQTALASFGNCSEGLNRVTFIPDIACHGLTQDRACSRGSWARSRTTTFATRWREKAVGEAVTRFPKTGSQDPECTQWVVVCPAPCIGPSGDPTSCASIEMGGCPRLSRDHRSCGRAVGTLHSAGSETSRILVAIRFAHRSSFPARLRLLLLTKGVFQLSLTHPSMKIGRRMIHPRLEPATD